MRLGFGSGSGEIFDLLAQAGENGARDRACTSSSGSRVARHGRHAGRDEGARARRRPDRLGAPQPIEQPQFVTPYDREDLDRRSPSRSTTSPTRSRTRPSCSASTASSRRRSSRSSSAAPTSRASERARIAARRAQAPARLVATRSARSRRSRTRRTRVARAARARPVQGRPHRPGDRDPLEGHLRGARGRGRRVRDGGAPHRQHPRQERVAQPGWDASLNSRNSPVTR